MIGLDRSEGVGVRVRGDALHVLLINKSAWSVRAALVLPAAGIATVQRLLAPPAAALGRDARRPAARP
jgi:hypothetical protein